MRHYLTPTNRNVLARSVHLTTRNKVVNVFVAEGQRSCAFFEFAHD